nr:GDP-L-fucose synthase [Ahniella affigens]
MVGSAVMRRLQAVEGLAVQGLARPELDFRDRVHVFSTLASLRPDVLIIAAAKVGGIEANRSQPVRFLSDNLQIELNLIDAAHAAGVQQVLFLGSSCIYPKFAEQPIEERSLLTGALEVTNEAYAIAKIAGIRLCEAYESEFGRDYRSLMPTNLYGPGDNFDPVNSHVIPGMMRRFHEAAKLGADQVSVWGTGTPKREFLHVDDLADAVLFVLNCPRATWLSHTAPRQRFVNVGVGNDLAIAELAALIAKTVGFRGEIVFDPTKPDGTPRKLLDVSRMAAMGWQARTPLADGLAEAYRWYLDHLDTARQ